MTKDEIIESLPGDLQPWGAIWLPVLLRWGEDTLTDFIRSASGMPWDVAYQRVVKSMTPAEKVEELKLRRSSLKQLNKENIVARISAKNLARGEKDFVVDQRKMFFSLLAKTILSINA